MLSFLTPATLYLRPRTRPVKDEKDFLASAMWWGFLPERLIGCWKFWKLFLALRPCLGSSGHFGAADKPPILPTNGHLCWQKIYLFYFGPWIGELSLRCLAGKYQLNFLLTFRKDQGPGKAISAFTFIILPVMIIFYL